MRARAMASEGLEEQPPSGVSQEQIKLFKTFDELKVHLDSLPLKRVLVQEIPEQASLDGCYVGGKVLNVLSESYSQGHNAMVFVEDGDAGMDALHIIFKVSGDLIELMPTLTTEYMLFVGGAYMEDDEIEFSQDTGE